MCATKYFALIAMNLFPADAKLRHAPIGAGLSDLPGLLDVCNLQNFPASF
jgi:hypothetical protein